MRTKGVHRGNPVGIIRRLGAGEGGSIEKQGDILLFGDLLKDDGVKNQRVALVVAPKIFQEDLIDYPALARIAPIGPAVEVGSNHPQPHLRGGIASQHRPVLHQNHLHAIPCGGNGGADSCHPAAHHAKIGRQKFPF